MQFYALIHGGTIKEKRKIKVEIKGENVRLISTRASPTAGPGLDPRPDRGRSSPLWLAGPCHPTLYEVVGAGDT